MDEYGVFHQDIDPAQIGVGFTLDHEPDYTLLGYQVNIEIDTEEPRPIKEAELITMRTCAAATAIFVGSTILLRELTHEPIIAPDIVQDIGLIGAGALALDAARRGIRSAWRLRKFRSHANENTSTGIV